MRPSRRWLVGPLVGLTAACTLGPVHETPRVEMPATFHESGAAAPSSAAEDRWWTLVGDATLNALVERALAQNLDLEAADTRVRAARAQRDAAAGNQWPSVDAEGRAGRQSQSLNGPNLAPVRQIPGARVPRTLGDDRAGFDASWEIDLFGHVRRTVEGANARYDAAIENARDARVRIAGEVARNYIELRTTQARLAIARDNVAADEQTVRLVQLRYDAGETNRLDLQRATGELEASRAALPTLDAQVRANVYALGVLLAAPTPDLDAMLATTVAWPTLPDAVPVGVPSDLLRRRADVRAAERQLAAATADVGVAVADQFPRFSLTGTLGFESTQAGQFTQAASRYWSVFPQVSVPLFEGGRLRHQVEAREAQRDEAVAIYRKDVLQALADVETALVRYTRERERGARLDANVQALDGALALARQRYDEGESSLVDVLDVQRQWNQASDQRAQSIGQTVLDWIVLNKALGGGWGTSSDALAQGPTR